MDLNKLHEKTTERLLREIVASEERVPTHNAGSGIVTGWDPEDSLPDIRIGTILPPYDRLKVWIKDLCHKWCKRGLVNATEGELDAVVHGRKVIQWYRFEKQCNIPTSNNLSSVCLSEYAWECFQEECFDQLVGWPQDD